MSLPPGFLEELRARVSIAQVAGRKVSWDQRKSNPAKGDWWAPCPFHQEKTASFHVDDRKGFFYCFGCHAKGDAISFVKETENVSFMEAVEILAREAGMAMPARDPKAQERADRRGTLAEVMERAVRYYRRCLAASVGAAAREYLDRRGLSAETRDRFEIGFAPDDRAGLTRHLAEAGIPEADLIEAGLSVRPDDGGAPFDRFRGRIMFPIRDARGRCIAFGGRALSPQARAKYLNSPETPLFDKSRTLYNLRAAREAAGKAGGLIVAEGYMDVIALAQAGLAHAVAPLGTAITEHQLALLWRIAPEPVIALDGDAAGLRAAYRLIDIALPLLEPGLGLRFALLPEGKDPDDLIRAGGARAIEERLAAAEPMVRLLWRRETEGQVFDSPERRAALDARLRALLGKIRDRSLRRHYGEALNDLRRELFGARGGARGRGGGPWVPRHARQLAPVPTPASKASPLARGDIAPDRIREALILAAAIRAPGAALELEGALERLPIGAPDLAAIRSALLSALAQEPPAEGGAEAWSEAVRAHVAAHIGRDPLEQLLGLPPLRIHPHLRPGVAPDLVAGTLREEIVKHAAIKGAEAELREAEEDLLDLADEGITWRLAQVTEARERATRAADLAGGVEEEDREDLSQKLQKLLDDQVWVKKKR